MNSNHDRRFRLVGFSRPFPQPHPSRADQEAVGLVDLAVAMALKQVAAEAVVWAHQFGGPETPSFSDSAVLSPGSQTKRLRNTSSLIADPRIMQSAWGEHPSRGAGRRSCRARSGPDFRGTAKRSYLSLEPAGTS
jgi:hypothetical protein